MKDPDFILEDGILGVSCILKTNKNKTRHLAFLQLWLTMIFLMDQLQKSQALSILPSRKIPKVLDSKEARDKFENDVKPFSIVSVVDQQVASLKYLQAPHLTQLEREGIHFFVDKYLLFHKQNRYNGRRYLIFSPTGAGGIGDRTNYLIYTYWLAVLSRRVFLVDWQQPYQVTRYLTSARRGVNLFYDEKHDRPRRVTARVLHSTLHTAFLNATHLQNPWEETILMSNTRTVVASRRGFPNSFSAAFLDFNRPKELRRVDLLSLRSNHHLRRAILHHVFRTHDNLRHSHLVKALSLGLRTPYTALSRNAPTTPYIAVHARIGIGIGEGAGRFTNIGNKQYEAAKCLATRAIALSNMASPSQLPIFLATDTLQFRKIFRDAVTDLSNRRIPVVTGEWNVVHTGRMHLNRTKGLQNAISGSYMDLVLLGHAQHIVAFYSSFPRLALWLGDAESLTEIRNELCL